MNIKPAFYNVEEGQRIENPHNLFSQNVGGIGDIHKLHSRLVYLLHFKGFVKHDNGVWRIFYDGIGEAFRLFLKERQAHGKIRLSVEHRHGLFAAGIIAAASAVQLVLRTSLAHFS